MKALLYTLLLILPMATPGITEAAALSAGNKALTVKLSSASIGAENYTIAGLAANYFVIDNLSVGGAYEYWFSGSPSVSKLTLESTYFIPASEQIKPYIGALYSRYFISDLSDLDTLGYRAGIAYLNSPLILSVGIKQETYLTERESFSGTDTTTEFLIGFSF